MTIAKLCERLLCQIKQYSKEKITTPVFVIKNMWLKNDHTKRLSLSTKLFNVLHEQLKMILITVFFPLLFTPYKLLLIPER